jgi:hypothetical protein
MELFTFHRQEAVMEHLVARTLQYQRRYFLDHLKLSKISIIAILIYSLFPGVYTCSACANLLINANVVFDSVTTSDVTIIRPSSGNAFNITGASTVSFTDITFDGANAGVNIVGSTVLFDNCTFSGIQGATIYALSNSSNNMRRVFFNHLDVTMSKCTITGNKGTTSAPVRFSGGSSIWDNCNVIGNSGGTLGGALLFDNSHKVTLQNSNFRNNYLLTSTKSSGYGGAVCVSGAVAKVK